MGNKKRIIIILVLLIALISVLTAIFLAVFSIEPTHQVMTLPQETIQPSCYLEEIETPTATQAPTATPMPEKPKYIFYIIGDGMGFSHLLLGSAYEKVLYEDSKYQPYWERFDVKTSCIGGIESAKGGTMLATGYDGKQGVIAMDNDGNKLVTILDRASEAGFSTGVISNSYIMDATPATFLAHTMDRGEYLNISNQIPFSDVDFISSGGMNYFLNESQAEQFGEYDIRGMKYIYNGDASTMDNFAENGYLTYMGKEGSYFMDMDDYSWIGDEKIFSLLVSKNTSYQYNKYGSRKRKMEIHEPDLDEMTQTGIEILSQNENGFVFVIEEALIDKASHNLWTQYVASEMHMLNETLGVIFDFYEKHPYETLIILTADHETGDMSYNESFAESMAKLSDINWHSGSAEINRFLSEEWGLKLNKNKIDEKKEVAELDIWGGEEKNYTLLHSYIASSLCESSGITINSKYHSKQKVPCYVMGFGAENFAECTIINEIAPEICEIMDWKTLPEIIK